MRDVAAWAIDRTLQSRAPLDRYLQEARGRSDERDHGLLFELTRGTLTWLRRLDHIISLAARRPIAKIDVGLLVPLRLGVYQLCFLDRVPAHAVVNQAVEQAHAVSHKGGASFVNGVLRRVARSPSLESWPVEEGSELVRLAIEHSHPDFLVQRWWNKYGEATTRALLEANNRPKPLHLLAFSSKGGRYVAAEDLIEEGIEVVPSKLAPQGLTVAAGRPLGTRTFAAGRLYVQDVASQAAALVPPPEKDEVVLDVAAAPGGKTFALVSEEPSVRAIAADVDFARLRVLQQNTQRLGLDIALLAQDATRLAVNKQFDRVVVDLPCSGTGTFRKNPELKWRLSEREIARLARLSQRMLSRSSRSVRTGGLLVAISCSIEEEENERVFENFLEKHEDFERLPLAGRLSPFCERAIEARGRWRLLPEDDHDGFTVHVAIRR